MITRLDDAGISALMGGAALERMVRRNRGGESGHKGVRYEHLFAAHRAARLARKYLEQDQDAVIEWQSRSFVDDVVVRRDSLGSFKGYQLKNAQQASWTGGEAPIKNDFADQKRLCDAEGYQDIRLRVVCSDAEVATSMKTSVPGDISQYSGAFEFPYSPEVLPLLMRHDWMAEDFGYLSRAPHPTTVEAEQVATVLVGAIGVMGNAASLSGLLAKARTVSPQIIRAFESDATARSRLSDELITMMDGWPDFSYVIIKGFLNWSAFGGSTTGILPFDCSDARFAPWQKHIVGLGAKTFEQVEGVF